MDFTAKIDLHSLVSHTADGSATLRHPKHGEQFHSHAGAWREAHDLYQKSSGYLEDLLRPTPISILDVGLGLGYNAIASLESWLQGPGLADLTLFSAEIEPTLVAALATGEAPWMQSWSPTQVAIAKGLEPHTSQQYRACFTHPTSCHKAFWEVEVGSILELKLTGPYHFIWHDAFSRRNCSKLWDSSLFTKYRASLAPGGCLLTYSVARPVVTAFEQAGWTVKRIPTSNHQKRHWLKAHL